MRYVCWSRYDTTVPLTTSGTLVSDDEFESAPKVIHRRHEQKLACARPNLRCLFRVGYRQRISREQSALECLSKGKVLLVLSHTTVFYFYTSQ
jgi:hypothetical protein